MTREEIIRMAREAGFVCSRSESVLGEMLANFAALVEQRAVAAEREACAKVVEQYCGAWDDGGYALAAKIRARDNQ